MSDVTARKCQNQACEDGWINLRNLTALARPCLDCNPTAAAISELPDAKLKEFASWRDAPSHLVIADLAGRLDAARSEAERLTRDGRSLYVHAQHCMALLDTANEANSNLRAEADRHKAESTAWRNAYDRSLNDVAAIRAESVTLTEQRDRARSVLRDIACHWQCLECGAACPSSTWFGSRNKVFVIGRLVHNAGCAVADVLGEVTNG